MNTQVLIMDYSIQRRANSGGMTLIELMVVTAIIAVLAGIAYPSYRQQVVRSNRSEAKAQLMQTAQEFERCYTRQHTFDGCNVADHASESGRYFIDVTPQDQTFIILAVPGGAQANDTKCGTLSIDHRGQKQRSGTGELAECWQR
jgi:type IV pilus assembly protein PilE